MYYTVYANTPLIQNSIYNKIDVFYCPAIHICIKHADNNLYVRKKMPINLKIDNFAFISSSFIKERNIETRCFIIYNEIYFYTHKRII